MAVKMNVHESYDVILCKSADGKRLSGNLLCGMSTECQGDGTTYMPKSLEGKPLTCYPALVLRRRSVIYVLVLLFAFPSVLSEHGTFLK